MSNSLNAFVATIRKDFPDLAISSMRQIPIGLDHLVVEINGRYIFRMPAKNPERQEREIAVIAMLRRKGISIVPSISFVGRRARYFGYERIDGVTLSEHEAGLIPPANRRRLAAQIAGFLVQLHSEITLAQGHEWGIPEYDLKRFDQIMPTIAEKFSEDQTLVSFARRAVLNCSAIGKDISLRRVLHWDLHNGNLILDPVDYSLRGVIDFDEVIICDAHAEFRSLYRFNPALAHETINVYNELTGLQLSFETARQYAWLVRFADLAEAARENGRVHRAALRRLRGWVEREMHGGAGETTD